MKYAKFLLLLVLPLFFASAANPNAQEVNWQKWNEGFPLANKENKIVLIDVYTDWCGWCKRMDADTYSNKEVISLIDEHFVPIKINPEHADAKYEIDGQEMTGRELLGLLSNGERFGYPTTFFLYPAEKRVFMEVGYKDANAFKQILTNLVNHRDTIKSGEEEKK